MLVEYDRDIESKNEKLAEEGGTLIERKVFEFDQEYKKL